MNINLNLPVVLIERLVLAVERIADYLVPELPDLDQVKKPRPSKQQTYKDIWEREQDKKTWANRSILNPDEPPLHPSPDQINRTNVE